MGFYIRKSIRFGALRLNLSKSGLGLSAGVKGFRVGTGPRGNYVHVGAGGLYYRQSLNPSSNSGESKQVNEQRLQEPVVTEKPEMEEIDSKDTLQIVDAKSEALIDEIRRKAAIPALWPWVTTAILICSVIAINSHRPLGILLFLLMPLAGIFTRVFDDRRKTTVILYDLDAATEKEYSDFYNAFENFNSSEGTWLIEAKSNVTDAKYNAGASELVRRKKIRPGTGKPKHIKTNVPVPFIPVGKQTLYFLPDKLLILENKSAGAVAYSGLCVNVEKTRFIETERVPSDAETVDHTWRYVNKKGGPDKRFKDNPQLPIALYAQLDLTSATGLWERLNVSNVANTVSFSKAISKLSNYYKTIESK